MCIGYTGREEGNQKTKPTNPKELAPNPNASQTKQNAVEWGLLSIEDVYNIYGL